MVARVQSQAEPQAGVTVLSLVPFMRGPAAHYAFNTLKIDAMCATAGAR
jgi:hypothetical protein